MNPSLSMRRWEAKLCVDVRFEALDGEVLVQKLQKCGKRFARVAPSPC